MKWFMHQSKASRDLKLRKVLMKYGSDGYALYWYCLEDICANLEPRLTFELESDCEILAHELKIDTLRVEEIMRYMVELGLFEESNGVITCLKLACHLGDSFTRNENLKAIIKAAKSQTVSDVSQTVSRLSQGEERRGEEIDTGRKRPLPRDFVVDDSMIAYVKEKFPRLNWELATEEWLEYVQKNNVKYVDWRKAWQSGMRKANEWREEKAAKAGGTSGMVVGR